MATQSEYTLRTKEYVTTNQRACTIKRKWLVLFSGIFIKCVSVPFLSQMSILYRDVLEEFDATNAETGSIQATGSGTIFAMGFLVGSLVSSFGVQRCGIFGALLAFFGLSISFTATSVTYLTITTGIISGSGISFLHICSSVAVGQYFTKQSSKKWSMQSLSIGTNIGSVCYSYTIKYLLQEYGWRGTLLIVGGIMLNCLPAVAIFISPQTQKYRNSFSLSSTRQSMRISLNEKARDLIAKIKTITKNATFMLQTLALITSMAAINAVLVFLVDFFESKGFDKANAIFILFCMNIARTVFVFLPSILNQIPRVGILTVSALHALFCGLMILVFLHVRTLSHFVVVACAFGVSFNGIYTFMPFTVVKLVGLEDYSVALGFLFTTLSIGVISCGPIAGKLRDISGSYHVPFYCAASSFFLSSLIYCFAAYIRSRELRKNETLKADTNHKKMQTVIIKRSFPNQNDTEITRENVPKSQEKSSSTYSEDNTEQC